MSTLDNYAQQSLGLAANSDAPNTNICLGQMPYIGNAKVLQIAIENRNQRIIEKIENEELTSEQKAELKRMILLTYDDYSHALKEAPKLSKEIAESRALESTIRDARISGEYNDYIRALERQEQNMLRGEMDARVTEHEKMMEQSTRAIAYKMSGQYALDQEKIMSVESRYGNIIKLELEIEKKKLIRSYKHPRYTLNFSNEYSSRYHTPDWEGYEHYLRRNSPDILEALVDRGIDVRIKEEDRLRHTYVVGGSGSGKTELLKVMVNEYKNNHPEAAVIVLDPHGDMVEDIAKWQNDERLVYLDPYLAKDKTFTINPLQPPKGSTPEAREVIAQQIMGAFEELLKGGAGASLSTNMRALVVPCLIVLLDKGDASLTDLQTFLNDDHNDLLIALGQKSERPAIRRFFEREFADKSFTVTKQSLRTKLQSLFNSGVFYNVVNGKNTVELEEAINQKKTILFNLAKGRIGNESSEALGRFIIALLQGIALRRQDVEKSQRVPVHVFIDECQNYIGTSTQTILEEARKYGVHLTLAQQVAGRGMNPEMRTVVLNNTNIKMVGRTAEDQRMAKLLGLELGDVQKLPVGEFYCRAGNLDTFKFIGSGHLLGGAADMSPEEQTVTRTRQEASHYRHTLEAASNAPTGSVKLF